jgi:LPXTG-motif cell wall-anchored protein
VPFRVFNAGAAVGLMPGILALTLLGGTWHYWFDNPWAWLAAGLLILAGFIYWRRRRSSGSPSTPSSVETENRRH